jgi:hypothetical protein
VRRARADNRLRCREHKPTRCNTEQRCNTVQPVRAVVGRQSGLQVVAVAVEVWGASTAATELLGAVCAAVIPAALSSSLPPSEQVDLLAALSHLCQR